MQTASAQAPFTSGGVQRKEGDPCLTSKAWRSQSKQAATYTPGTSDQTIASGQYLDGAQTIKGDANLVSQNILKDVTIFGVTGNLALPTISQDSTTKILSIS